MLLYQCFSEVNQRFINEIEFDESPNFIPRSYKSFKGSAETSFSLTSTVIESEKPSQLNLDFSKAHLQNDGKHKDAMSKIYEMINNCYNANCLKGELGFELKALPGAFK